MYIHENNINNKIAKNYGGHFAELTEFRDNVYYPMRNEIEKINFSLGKAAFENASDILNSYYSKLHSFSKKYEIKSQSKFESSFLEELNYYLFRNLDIVQSNELSIYNKGIYAGLKIKDDLTIDVIKKDVDFCIGKQISLIINNQKPISLIIPAISVEVKTYLDATMFGEIKSSSKTLKSASPNSKAYVLIGYKNLADEHIIAAKQDSTLDEIFVLQSEKYCPIDADTLFDYYIEIADAIKNLSVPITLSTPGRLLKNI